MTQPDLNFGTHRVEAIDWPCGCHWTSDDGLKACVTHSSHHDEKVREMQARVRGVAGEMRAVVVEYGNGGSDEGVNVMIEALNGWADRLEGK